MKRMTVYLLLILLRTAIVYAELFMETISNPDGTIEHIFYSDGKEIAKQILDEDENIIKTIGKIPDGIVREYYESGKLKAEWNYEKGKPDGICKTYYESGELMFEYNYKDGDREGITRSFYMSGRLKYEYKYRGGKLDGTVKKYYRNGNIAFVWKYKDGKREGIAKSYSKNGSLKAKWNYKDDQLNGMIRIYYKSGGIKYIDTYRGGYKVNRKAYEQRGKLEFDQDYPFDEKRKN